MSACRFATVRWRDVAVGAAVVVEGVARVAVAATMMMMMMMMMAEAACQAIFAAATAQKTAEGTLALSFAYSACATIVAHVVAVADLHCGGGAEE